MGCLLLHQKPNKLPFLRLLLCEAFCQVCDRNPVRSASENGAPGLVFARGTVHTLISLCSFVLIHGEQGPLPTPHTSLQGPLHYAAPCSCVHPASVDPVLTAHGQKQSLWLWHGHRVWHWHTQPTLSGCLVCGPLRVLPLVSPSTKPHAFFHLAFYLFFNFFLLFYCVYGCFGCIYICVLTCAWCLW